MRYRAFAIVMAAVSSAAAQDSIPVRRLSNIVATDSGVLSEVLGVRAIPRGRVIVNDWDRRRLLIFDSTMKRFSVLTDSTPGAPGSYGWLAGFIVPYTRDSTLFILQNSGAFIVLDPNGRMVRTMAPPRPRDLSAITVGALSRSDAGYDPIGRLIYPTARAPSPLPSQADEPRRVLVKYDHDSTAIVRVDPYARSADTLALLAMPVRKVLVDPEGDGRFPSVCEMNNPLPAFDQWAMLPDGTIAILRASDYHIDWIRNGKTASTPKMPFAWKRVTDADKQAKIDSAHRAFDEYAARVANTSTPGIGGISRQHKLCPFRAVDLNEMPDYYPPNPARGRRGFFADREGNLWILPSTSLVKADGLVFDIVNRKGEIFERVVIPAGRYIVGFGADGVVYLQSSYGRGAIRLERGRVERQ